MANSDDKPETIEQNIRHVQSLIKANPKFGNTLKMLAVKAIYEGFGSEDWKKYMRHYAKTTKQLKRLTDRQFDCHKYTEPARAYLVGNAVCLPGTDTNLMQGINGFLDETLANIPGPDDPLEESSNDSRSD
jgi:hypothetical protein